MFLQSAMQRFQRHGVGLATCMIAASAAIFVLAGCAATPTDGGKPAVPTGKLTDTFATPDWAKFSTGERTKAARPITPDDLIGSDGSCAATRIAAQPAPETDGTNNAPVASMAPVGPTVSGGIALAMSECDVAQRAGFPGNVEIGSEAGGERSAVLTYRQGPWPGIYRFRGGRLVSIERVEVIEPPKVKKVAKPTRPPSRTNAGNPKPQ